MYLKFVKNKKRKFLEKVLKDSFAWMQKISKILNISTAASIAMFFNNRYSNCEDLFLVLKQTIDVDFEDEKNVNIKNKKKKLFSVEEVEQLITIENKSIVFFENKNELVTEVQNVLNEINSWIAKFQKNFGNIENNNQNNNNNSNHNETLVELLREAMQLQQKFSIDLKDFTDVIVQSTKKYCFCRDFYHSQMIGCDECEEWYHWSCIGLNAFQVEKIENFVCVRCLLKKNVLFFASQCGEIANKWFFF
jgi:hypothetical protein